jgi:hypothetical protein
MISDAVVLCPEATETTENGIKRISSVARAHSVPNDAELAEHAEVIRTLCRRTVEQVIEIGRRLTEVKAGLSHGRWLPWLKNELSWSDETARRYMRLYDFAKSQRRVEYDGVRGRRSSGPQPTIDAGGGASRSIGRGGQGSPCNGGYGATSATRVGRPWRSAALAVVIR